MKYHRKTFTQKLRAKKFTVGTAFCESVIVRNMWICHCEKCDEKPFCKWTWSQAKILSTMNNERYKNTFQIINNFYVTKILN